MDSIYALIFCSLLLQSDGRIPPNPSERLPVVPQTEFVPVLPQITSSQPIPAAEPSVVPAAANAGQARFRNGVLMIPRHNHVVLSARESAELISLNTEKRDADGNIIRNNNGEPILIPTRRGMNVFKGQVLGKFDDSELRSILRINQAQLDLAKAEQDKNIEREYAANGVQVAYAEYKTMLEGNARLANSFSAMEVRRAALAVSQADSYLKLQTYNIDEVATRKVTVQENELERTKGQIERRQLVTQIDGMIVGINAAEGEWLREGHEVLEIMRLDTLWVRVRANVNEYERSDLDGKQAVIQVTLPNGRTETFQGMVVFCHPKSDTDDAFEVDIEVQNRRVGNFWLLQPGRNDADVVILRE